jgi:hypothetical protein
MKKRWVYKIPCCDRQAPHTAIFRRYLQIVYTAVLNLVLFSTIINIFSTAVLGVLFSTKFSTEWPTTAVDLDLYLYTVPLGAAK